jgi:hypothetical protein
MSNRPPSLQLPLRSAMKYPSASPSASVSASGSLSRPTTPLPCPTVQTSLNPHVSLQSLPSPSPSPASTLDSTLSSPFPLSPPSTSEMLLTPSYIAQSPTASTVIGQNASQGYTPKVCFDTFENPAASMFSFTLQVKSDGYERQPSARVFLCASSSDVSGRQALDWAIGSLAQDGDELIVFRGIDQDDLGREVPWPIHVLSLSER